MKLKLLNDIIEKCEKLHKSKKNYFSVITLVSRLYIGFLETGSSGYADNAFFVSVKSFKDSTQNIVYALLAAFFELETGKISAAEKRISVCENYKNYLKNNKPVLATFYLYIDSIISFRKKDTRSSIKKYREILALWEENPKEYSILLTLALIDIEYDNFGSAKKRLEYYMSISQKNVLFYLCLMKYFTSKNKSIYCTPKLLYPFLRWGLAHGINLENILKTYSNKICDIFSEHKEVCFRLYDLWENEEILKQICLDYIENNNLSKDAFKYYEMAVKKQIFVPGLNNFYIRSSYFSNVENFGIYPVKIFIKYGDMKEDIKPYIYYLLIENKKFSDLLNENFYDIVEFGIYAVRRGLKGKYYNSIYKYIIENKYQFNGDESFIKNIEEILFSQMFLCKLSTNNKLIKKCFVFEKNRDKPFVCEFKDGECELKISSSYVKFFLEDENKQFIDAEIKVDKYVESIGLGLCKALYSDGFVSEELDFLLANYYINIDYPEEDCIKIFERVLETNISDDFRTKVLLASGNLYYYNMDFENAFKCFENLELKYVKDKFISNVFEVFIEKENFDKAAKIISEKSYCISDKLLFYGVRKIIKFEHLKPLIAECVYELVLKSRYDRHMIKLLTEHYKGGRRDWLLICNVLYDMGTPNKSIDEKLMKMSMQSRVFDEKVQLVFSVMYENDRGNELINEFAEYCCYEMIVNSVMPEEETIRILEKLFFSNNNEMISFALSHIYLVYGIKTKNRHTIMHLALEFMKKRSFILPVFKEYENEFSNDLYIEKNCTFIYFAPSDKSVLFYFREKGEFDFYSKAMRYLDFGIYYINIPVFFGEEIEYYICENKEKGSIETQKQIVANNNMNLHSELSDDPFFEINNAIICENIYRYEEAENIINKKIRKNNKLRCKLL